MGREIKRVPLDFNWPLEEVWEGFLNPYYKHASKCSACGGRGYSPEAKHLYDQWYGYAHFRPAMTGSKPFLPDEFLAHATRSVEQMGMASLVSFYGTHVPDLAITRECARLAALYNNSWSHHLDADDVQALIQADRLWDFTRTPRTPAQEEIVRQRRKEGHNSWLPEDNGYVPTPAEVNEWSRSGFGHDSLNCSICVRAKAERLGYTLYCVTCNGDGEVWDSAENKEKCETWEKQEPPAGEGWQLWETVSEGSPVSPVFPTADALADWLISSKGYSPQAARSFVKQGWAPSLVSVPGVGVWDGITDAGIAALRNR